MDIKRYTKLAIEDFFTPSHEFEWTAEVYHTHLKGKYGYGVKYTISEDGTPWITPILTYTNGPEPRFREIAGTCSMTVANPGETRTAWYPLTLIDYVIQCAKREAVLQASELYGG